LERVPSVRIADALLLAELGLGEAEAEAICFSRFPAGAGDIGWAGVHGG
jgi:hypothetical protein